MTRISRISTPRATLFAIALITVVMLTFGAFSAEEAAGVGVLAGEPAADATIVLPCPLTAVQGETQAFTGTETE
ncbi:MAG: hypothetical protein OXH15_11465 [Gammaproteobacteria bacterium]|nr:hypothetical protein [Gammaproteobacteria bacterium]